MGNLGYQILGSAFDCALLWFAMSDLPTRKTGKLPRLFLVGFYVLLTSLIREYQIDLVLDMLMRISVYVVILRLLKEVSWIRVFYYATICYMIVELCHTLFSYAATWLWPEIFDAILYLAHENTLGYLFLLAMKIAAVLPLKRLVARRKGQRPERSQFFLLMLPFVLFIYLRHLNLSVHFHQVEMNQSVAVLAIIASAICYVMVLLSERQVIYLQNRNELNAMTLLLEKEREYYEERNRNSEEIRKLAHDMKNHLRTLQKMSHEPPVQEYVSAIIGEVSRREMLYQTGNPALDIILNDKLHLCKEKEIRLTPYLDAAGLTFIRTVDMSVLFGNLLDNAIEAVEGIEEAGRREIRLKIAPKGQYFVIRVENPFDGELTRREGSQFQSKKKEGLHGYGLANVTQVVDSYDGQMTVTAENGLFTVTILLRIPEKAG